MLEVKKVENKDEITKITLEIMLSLPEWFSPVEDIKKKSIMHRDNPFFAAYKDGKAVGFIALLIHNKYSIEIFNLGVLKEYHRMGIGKMLLESTLNYCKNNQFTYLTVKTLDESANYEPYESTRSFYYKNGFIPLEVLKNYWNEDNPCLFLARYLI